MGFQSVASEPKCLHVVQGLIWACLAGGRIGVLRPVIQDRVSFGGVTPYDDCDPDALGLFAFFKDPIASPRNSFIEFLDDGPNAFVSDASLAELSRMSLVQPASFQLSRSTPTRNSVVLTWLHDLKQEISGCLQPVVTNVRCSPMLLDPYSNVCVADVDFVQQPFQPLRSSGQLASSSSIPGMIAVAPHRLRTHIITAYLSPMLTSLVAHTTRYVYRCGNGS